MSRPLSPKAYANTLAKAWGKHFPVDIRQIALEYSAPQKDPIAKIEALPISLDNFEGALLRSGKGAKWGIAYSAFIREEGKINFTVAHELGHYLLHRTLESILCSEEDLRDFARASQAAETMEQEANEFASYLLMPMDDFRAQLTGDAVNMDLITHCATRYGTSLAASALKLIEFIDRPVICISSRDGVVQWSRSSEAAFRSGLYLRRGTPVPCQSLTFACQEGGVAKTNRIGLSSDSSGWFAGVRVHESAVAQPHYGSVFTLLQCWGSARVLGGGDTDEEPIEDTFDRFRSFSR